MLILCRCLYYNYYDKVVTFTSSFPIAIFIGFERPEYKFNEVETGFTWEDSPILTVKENGVVSEQIFRVSITAGPVDLPGIGNALFQPLYNFGVRGDYSLGQSNPTLVDLFEADVQSKRWAFTILGDTIPEGAEAFGFTIATTSGDGGQFSVGTIGSTVVIIEDDDGKFIQMAVVDSIPYIFTRETFLLDLPTATSGENSKI